MASMATMASMLFAICSKSETRQQDKTTTEKHGSMSCAALAAAQLKTRLTGLQFKYDCRFMKCAG